MKTQLFSGIGVFATCVLISWGLSAQNCSSYYPMIKGATYQLDHFSAKDKKTGSNTYTMKEVKKSGNKTEALMDVVGTNEKNEKQFSSEMAVICQGDKILMDMRSMVPQNQTQAFKDMELKADGSFLELPNNPQVGQKLPDGEMKMDFVDKKSGEIRFTMTIKITNRVIEGKETITTPAGTFECFKLKYDGNTETKIPNIPIGMPKFNYSVVEYICPGKGLVKTTTFNKNGKLVGYSQMAKI